HRHGERRQHSGRDRRAEPACRSRDSLGAARLAGRRHVRRARPWPHLRSARRGRVPGHGDDRARPRAGPREERQHAGSSARGQSDAGLQLALRQRQEVDAADVCRGDLQDDPEMKQSILVVLAFGALVRAQAPPPAAPQLPKAAAPIDLTGYWVSIVSEDWRYRMVTPAKGDYQAVPMTPDAVKIADA